MDSNDAVIRRISIPQAGAFTMRQAVAAGMSASALHRRVRRSAILRVHPNVYFGGHVLTLAARRWAAVLAVPGSMLTGEAALDEWGIRRWPSDAVEILVDRRHRGLDGVLIVESRTIHAEDCTTLQRRPTATVERALVDVAGRRTAGQLCQLLREAAFRDRLDIARLERTIDRNGNRAGIARLREALALHLHGHGGSDSSYEDRFGRMLERAGIGGVARNVVLVIHGEEMRVDFYIEHLGLVIEVDPRGHELPPIRREDGLREALCRAAGLRHLRVRGDQLRAGALEVSRLHRAWVANGRAVPPELHGRAHVRSMPARTATGVLA